MKAMFEEVLRDESGQGSSVRVMAFVLLGLIIVCTAGAVLFAVYQNKIGVDLMKSLLPNEFWAMIGLLVAGQFKSALVKSAAKKKQNESESVDVGKDQVSLESHKS